MQGVQLRGVLLGALVGVLGYLVGTVVLVPMAITALLDLSPATMSIAVLLLAAVPAGLGGVVASLQVRGRRGLARRADSVPTAALAGAAAGVVVAGLGALAMISNHATLSAPVVIMPVLVLTLAAVLGAFMVRPGHASRQPAGALTRDAGQASLEGLGVVAIAVILVSALLLAMTPGGVWLQDNIRVALCQITGGGDCGTAAELATEARPEPEHRCVVTDTRDNRETALSITWVQLESGDRIRVEELSGDRFRVSAEMSGGVGLQAGVGGGGSVIIDDQGYGVEAQAGASAVVAAGGGMTWVVDGEDSKQRLVDYLEGERDWRSIQATMGAAGPPGIVANGVTSAGRELWRWITDAYRPDVPGEVYAYTGIEGNASANATGILQNAAADAGTSTVLGARTDVATGATTMYYRSTVDGSAVLQSRGLSSADTGASGQVEMALAVTYDPEGMPVTVQAQHLMVGEASFEASVLFGDDIEEGGSAGRLYDARVSLTDDETRDIAFGLMRAAGVPTPNVAWRARGGHDAVTTFVDAARERGTMTRQDVTVDGSTSFALQGGGEVAGVGLGFGFSNSSSEMTMTDPTYWDGSTWQPWTGCAS